MQYSLLGSSTLLVSPIAFGSMSLKNDQSENEKLLHRAIELGINFFDTADLYDKGMNEVSLGHALKEKRNKVIIASKAGNQWRADGSGWDWNPSKDYILSCAEKSLKRLQTDHIDLYQLHGGTIDDPIDETIEAFELLKKQGKIRYYGISSIRPNVIREYIKRSSIVSVMMQYSLLDRRPEETVLDLLFENKIGVLSRGALAQGLLVDKLAKEYLGYSAEEVARAQNAVHAISNDQRLPAQTAVHYVLHHPAVSSAVIGIRTLSQLKEVTGALKTPSISDQEYETLQQILPAKIYEQHR